MSVNKFKLIGKKFSNGISADTSFLELATALHSKEWDTKQENAIDEYIEEIDHADPQIDDIYKLLEDYTVRNIFGKKNLNILDVGCGIDPNYPKYAQIFEYKMEESGNTYVGIDPIKYNNEKRKYPFICGRMEDVPDFLETKFDVFIFSTCLDHFEKIETVADAVRKIANPNAICIIWIGLHDTQIIAEQAGAQRFPALFKTLDLPGFIIKFPAFIIKTLATFWYYKKREKRLKNNIPLDNLHFHYFTLESIKKSLSFFGNITDTRKIPGTNGVFYVVEIN